jgi:AraC family transcriptional regulator
MQAWDCIQNSLEWIEKNLSGRIEITGLADVAQLSPFYFQRLFSRLVGKPVMEYVKLRRLAHAADHLAANKSRIIDAALDFGFENPETFTRAFRDAYGMTPEQYRAGPRQLSHFLKPDLSLAYRLVDENVPLAADGIILEVRRTVLAASRVFAGFSVQNPLTIRRESISSVSCGIGSIGKSRTSRSFCPAERRRGCRTAEQGKAALLILPERKSASRRTGRTLRHG